MTITTDHFHKQLGITIYDELEYILNDIKHYDLPIRIEDALRSAKEELDTTNNLLSMTGMIEHLKEHKRLLAENEELRKKLAV